VGPPQPVSTLLRDIRFAIRAFGRRPLILGGAIASLAVGVAANTLMFSVVNGVFFKRVPGVTRPERLVEIARNADGVETDVTFPVFRRLRMQTGVLEGLCALVLESISIGSGTEEPSVRGALAVTGNYFQLLGVRPVRGRLFAPDEAAYPAIAPVAVISYDVWQREFGGRTDVVGAEARINGTPVRVIGVLPRGFAGHHTGLLTDVFLPLGLAAPGLPDPNSLASGNASSVGLLGRLRLGITPAAATTALSASADVVAREGGESDARHPYAVSVERWGPLPYTIRPAASAFFSLLLALCGFALAMACMNVSTLLLAHVSERLRELAVRRALGASEGRLVRQIVTEVSVLFATGGVVGSGAALWITGRFSTFDPPVPVPGRLGAEFSPDLRVFLFSCC
jgi:putative ABC transport system permease protein